MIAPTLVKWSPDVINMRPTKKIVIIHATRSGKSYREFDKEFEATINWLTGPSGLSIHWVVDRDGIRTARLVPDDKCAKHAGQHNTETWGIEVCQGIESDGYTEPQIAKLVEVCRGYVNDFGVAPRHTLSMNESGFIGHQETPQGRAAGKSDPGRTFPWDTFIAGLSGAQPATPEAPTEEDNDMFSNHAWATWFNGRGIGPGETMYVVQAVPDFSLQNKGAKAILFQADLASGEVEFFHGGTAIPVGKVGEDVYIANLAEDGTINMRTRTGVQFKTLHCIGYYK